MRTLNTHVIHSSCASRIPWGHDKMSIARPAVAQLKEATAKKVKVDGKGLFDPRMPADGIYLFYSR
jgi:hypothetical protein